MDTGQFTTFLLVSLAVTTLVVHRNASGGEGIVYQPDQLLQLAKPLDKSEPSTRFQMSSREDVMGLQPVLREGAEDKI